MRTQLRNSSAGTLRGPKKAEPVRVQTPTFRGPQPQRARRPLFSISAATILLSCFLSGTGTFFYGHLRPALHHWPGKPFQAPGVPRALGGGGPSSGTRTSACPSDSFQHYHGTGSGRSPKLLGTTPQPPATPRRANIGTFSPRRPNPTHPGLPLGRTIGHAPPTNRGFKPLF